MSNLSTKPALTLAFGSLWIADMALTAEFVQEQGIQMEANPIVAWVIVTYGITAFIWVKLVILAVWLLLHKRVHVGIHAALVVIMLPVVYMGFVIATSI